jgi:hypothetical protein
VNSIDASLVLALALALAAVHTESHARLPDVTHPCLGSLEAVSLDDYAVSEKLAEHFVAERFEVLENAITCLLASKERLQSGHTGASAVYYFYRSQMPAPGLKPEQAPRVSRWLASRPQSIYAEFAALRLAYSSAWQTRGGNVVREVAAANMVQFQQGILKTLRQLDAATPEVKRTPLWHQLKFATLLDGENTGQLAEKAFDAGVREWPDFYDFYEAAISRRTPAWGGSWREVDEFAGSWARARQSTEGDSLYARLYLHLFWFGTNPKQTLVAWPRLRSSLEDLTARYPTVKYTNLAASLACLYSDRQAYVQFLKRTPGLAPSIWLDGTGFGQCEAKLAR